MQDDKTTQADDLRKILEITRSLVAASDVDDLLRLIADRAIELLHAERATVFLYEPAANELVSRVAHGQKDLRVPADRGIVGAVVASGKTINVPDAYADDRFNPDVDRKTGFRTRNILSVPLLDYEGTLVGVLQVLNKTCSMGVPPVSGCSMGVPPMSSPFPAVSSSVAQPPPAVSCSSLAVAAQAQNPQKEETKTPVRVPQQIQQQEQQQQDMTKMAMLQQQQQQQQNMAKMAMLQQQQQQQRHGQDAHATQEIAFDEYDVMLAESMAAQAGVAIQRHRLIGHYLQKQEMERAMQIAQEIQKGLLPRCNPSIEGFDIAGFCEPADQTGGDTYDFMALPGGRWMITVADATGHGIGPALVIAETRAMLRATSLHGSGAGEVLAVVNNLLADDLGDCRFVTCFFGLLEPAAGAMNYSSAGHGPMLFYKRSTGEFRSMPANTLPLGIMPDAPQDQAVRHLFDPGDFAVITTDGFFEASNDAGEEFGVERMTAMLHRDRDLPAEEMIANLHQAIHDFTHQPTHADDLTAVIVKKL